MKTPSVSHDLLYLFAVLGALAGLKLTLFPDQLTPIVPPTSTPEYIGRQ